jgi:murein L,D-transpeptidase YcbB/YkuD
MAVLSRFILVLILSALPFAAQAADLSAAIATYGGPFKADISAFYAKQGETLWTKDGKPNRDAGQVEEIFENSIWHGLNPANYLGGLEKAKQTDPDGYEILMTRAALQYARDMTGPRVSPGKIGVDAGTWGRAVSAKTILMALGHEKDRSDLLEKTTPRGKTYKALQEELKRLAKEGQDPARHVTVPYTGVLHVGDRSQAVIKLRQKLDMDAKNPDDATLYDDALGRKVQELQSSFGIKPDGIIGPRTIRMINASDRARLEQVVANLEWMRWVGGPGDAPKAILVNIPAMRLWAVKNNKVVHEMSVVVGRPDRPTPVFATKVTGVRFNPNWTMPMTIKRDDYLPKLQKDPLALAAKNITIQQVTDEGVAYVAPETVDWTKVTEQDLKSLRFVQKPGANNALGQIRLLMPNRYDVYLHDTNSPELFDRDGRMQSSGCVRMERPLEIADFVMDGTKGWDKDRLNALLESGRTRDLPTDEAIPIFLVYQTIWPGDNNTLIMGDDIYGLDAKLVQALKDSGRFPPI